MSAKLKSLKDGMLAGIAAEKTKATPVDRFALAEKAITSHPRGLLGQPVASTFSAESAASETPAERRVVKIPLDRLQENPLNARRIYDPQIVQERAASIATHGQQTPGLAAPDPAKPGWYVLIDGHYRKRALAAAGKTEMDCFIEDGLSDIDFYRLSFVLNEQRSGQSVLDNAIAWRQLLDEGKVKKKKIFVKLPASRPVRSIKPLRC